MNNSNAVPAGDLYRSPAILPMPEGDDPMLHSGKCRIYIVAGYVGYERRRAPGPAIVTLWGGDVRLDHL